LSIEDLYRQHASYPRNPRLAHALYRARLIEHWGTGTLRILRACEGSDIKVDFSIQAGSFVVRLLKTPHPLVEGSVKGSVKAYLPNSRRFLILFAMILVFPLSVSRLKLAFQQGKRKIIYGSSKSAVFCEESARAAAALGGPDLGAAGE